MRTLSWLAAFSALASLAHAGEPEGPHDGAEWQIWAYSSAAPAPLGTNATVLGLDGSVLREGSNGWTCMVGNPRPAPEGGWPTPHDAMPVCTDAVGIKSGPGYRTRHVYVDASRRCG